VESVCRQGMGNFAFFCKKKYPKKCVTMRKSRFLLRKIAEKRAISTFFFEKICIYQKKAVTLQAFLVQICS